MLDADVEKNSVTFKLIKVEGKLGSHLEDSMNVKSVVNEDISHLQLPKVILHCYQQKYIRHSINSQHLTFDRHSISDQLTSFE